MIAVSLIISIVAACVLLERSVESRLIRTVGTLILILICSVASNKAGLDVGKIEQISRFMRLQTKIVDILEQAKQQPGLLNELINALQPVSGRCEDIESSVDRLAK